MTARPEKIDDYFTALSDEKRAALEKLRKTIQDAAPDAEECFSYGLPAFCMDGKPLLAYGAGAKHCALYPLNPEVIEAHKEELKDFELSKGTIRFQPDKPIPGPLIRKLVKSRMKGIERKIASKRNR